MQQLSGEGSGKTGKYRSSCCGLEIVRRQNETLPYCPQCCETTTWWFVLALKPANQY